MTSNFRSRKPHPVIILAAIGKGLDPVAIDWGTAPAWAGVGIAALGSWLAVRQLSLSTKTQQQQLIQLELGRKTQENQLAQLALAAAARRDHVEIAQANIILSIDATYESLAMQQSRIAVRTLRHWADQEVNASDKVRRSAERHRELVCAQFSRKMGELWGRVGGFESAAGWLSEGETRAASEVYSEIMRLPNWMETIGRLCRSDLLPTSDVMALYDQVIITTIASFEEHIASRQPDLAFPNRRFLENATWLYQQALLHRAWRDNPVETNPVRSQIKWLRDEKRAG